MGLMLHERIDALALARKETFRDVGAAGESEGIKAMRLATWEATVWPALRRAMADHPELHGAKVKLETSTPTAFEVMLHGEGWDFTLNVCRGPLVVDIVVDCAVLASCAASEVRKARASVCQECAQWNGPPRSGAPCGTCGSINAEDRSAMLAEIDREIEAVEPAPSSERTPLPPGWAWSECYLRDRITANGPHDAYAGVDHGRIFSRDPRPPAIHNALITEAARLGLVCHEIREVAPEGYAFEVHDGWVEVTRTDGGLMFTGSPTDRVYAGVEAHWLARNSDPKRWAGHEPARQWAAYLLGEVAPPLREEGATS